MDRIDCGPLFVLALLLTVSCVDAGASRKDATPASPKDSPASMAAGTKVDTLCSYLMSLTAKGGNYVFQNDTQLVSFLTSTGYYEHQTKMAHKLDFKKWTYFAFAEDNYSRTIGDITERKATIIINYAKYIPPPCDTHPCDAYAPAPSVVIVFFIPFTKKAIVFTETIKYLEDE